MQKVNQETFLIVLLGLMGTNLMAQAGTIQRMSGNDTRSHSIGKRDACIGYLGDCSDGICCSSYTCQYFGGAHYGPNGPVPPHYCGVDYSVRPVIDPPERPDPCRNNYLKSCRSDSDCCSGLICKANDLGYQFCIYGKRERCGQNGYNSYLMNCNSDADCCDRPNSCLNNVCQACGRVDEKCTTNSDCCSDNCNGDRCLNCRRVGAKCSEKSQCCSGYCISNVCNQCRGGGQRCTFNSDCCSNRCSILLPPGLDPSTIIPAPNQGRCS